nr:MAG: antirepressor protein KilAC domain [Bacteriophage sp.]
MNAEIQTFNFNATPLRALTDENGDPWFVAKDVCNILGLNNVGQALTRLDDDEKSSITLNDGTPGTPNKAIVSESGLYSLILASRKPEAHEFKRWITHEVLPSIRKHGIYATNTTIDQILADPDFGIRLLTDLKNERAKRIEAENHVKELEPKAKALDDFTNVEDKLLIRDAAKILSNTGTPIKEKQLREWMASHDWIYKANCSWHATARHCTAGHLVMVMSQEHVTKADGTKFAYPPTVRITRKGLALLYKRLGETNLTNALEETITD